MGKKIVYFELLRVVAAIAVIMIHVLGPYRHLGGVIPDFDWYSAIGFNGASRWAVPVFIMITGALMLSDPRPFDAKYFIRRRVVKVIIPFLVWSIIYAFIASITLQNVNVSHFVDLITHIPFNETYYHLGFFYYFIPLYLFVPFIRPFCQSTGQQDNSPSIELALLIWLTLTCLKLMGIKFGIAENALLFPGYLLLGYWLHKHASSLTPILGLGMLALFATEYVTLSSSIEKARYSTNGWFSYKTINTVLIAAMVFVLCRVLAEKLTERTRPWIEKLSRHSLGIYLIHPLFLLPVRETDTIFGATLLTLPLMTGVILVLSYYSSVLLSRFKLTAWLVP